MLEKLVTEKRNRNTMDIDELSILEILKRMNIEDKCVPNAIALELETIEKVIHSTIESLKKGGRLIYIGAGTSGRLGVLDAVECPPTFGSNPDLVVGLIAGGSEAFMKAVEGAEDREELAREDLINLNVNENDMVIGIAASGRTPYVIGGLKYAKEVKANTASIACNKDAVVSQYSDISIEVDCGPEIVTGSTRLKAGTAQKNILNMISTVSFIGMGKVYSNLMVDMQATNYKLEKRAIRMLLEVLDIAEDEAISLLKQSDGNVKVAIFMKLSSLNKEESIDVLNQNGGILKKALASIIGG